MNAALLGANCCPFADTLSKWTPALADGADVHSSWPGPMYRATDVVLRPSMRQRSVAISRYPEPTTEMRVPPNTGP